MVSRRWMPWLIWFRRRFSTSLWDSLRRDSIALSSSSAGGSALADGSGLVEVALLTAACVCVSGWWWWEVMCKGECGCKEGKTEVDGWGEFDGKGGCD